MYLIVPKAWLHSAYQSNGFITGTAWASRSVIVATACVCYPNYMNYMVLRLHTIVAREMHNFHLLLNNITITTHSYRTYSAVYFMSLSTRPKKNFIILLRVRCSGSSRSWGVEKTIEMHNVVTCGQLWMQTKRRLNNADSVAGARPTLPDLACHAAWIAHCSVVLSIQKYLK